MVKRIAFVALIISYVLIKKHVNLKMQQLAFVTHFQIALTVVIIVYVALINNYVMLLNIVLLKQLLWDHAFQIVQMEHQIVSVELIM